MIKKTEKIGEIILKFNEIEFYLKQIIIKYLEPKKTQERFYSQILFNNSVISFSGKIKLFKNLNKENKWIKGKELNELIRFIYYLNNVRNSLVHTENAIEFEKNEEGKIIGKYDIIDFFKTDGSLNILRLNEVYTKFIQRYKFVKEELVNIHKKI